MDPKTIRKQLRNVIDECLTTEALKAIKDASDAQMNSRLDQIEKFCQSTITHMDERSRSIHSFLINEVKGKIQNDIFNAQVTMDAFIAVCAESGINIENLNQKIDAKKAEISQAIIKRNDEAMQADMESRVQAGREEAAAAQG